MDRRISPARSLVGALRLPGDKSISHRYALLGGIAEGETIIRNFAPGADCASTLRCLEALGVQVARRKQSRPSTEAQGRERKSNGDREGTVAPQQSAAPAFGEVAIQGRGLRGFQPPAAMLDAGNSGSTIRMLSGLLAGHAFRSSITGDESLQRRPMRRIMEPLARMGAEIEARNGDLPPLVIAGASLHGIEYDLPVPSAQVKSAVLLAGLLAQGETTVTEPVATRDHTEIALEQFGAETQRGLRRVSVCGGKPLRGRTLDVPGDISSAAFFICAALLLPDSNLMLHGVGLNPTRTALLDFLAGMGAQIKVLNVGTSAGELVGDINVRGGALRGGRIEGDTVTGLIDEIPVLAVLATQTAEGLALRDAKELRIKETDRIATVADNLRRMGARVEVHPDGLDIAGRQTLAGAEIDSFGDHRIAMAFAVAALAATSDSTIRDAGAAVVSYPGFFDELDRVAART
jgi:3-phosphoshikimate 1-carboxyvinyltransferase